MEIACSLRAVESSCVYRFLSGVNRDYDNGGWCKVEKNVRALLSSEGGFFSHFALLINKNTIIITPCRFRRIKSKGWVGGGLRDGSDCL